MATLKGREAWHTASGILLHGTIGQQTFDDPIIVEIVCDNGRDVS